MIARNLLYLFNFKKKLKRSRRWALALVIMIHLTLLDFEPGRHSLVQSKGPTKKKVEAVQITLLF